jgi:hypothetical protein
MNVTSTSEEQLQHRQEHIQIGKSLTECIQIGLNSGRTASILESLSRILANVQANFSLNIIKSIV